jgi:hypothetical protein
MIYHGKQDTPMLDLVRAGFLRSIVTPGSDQGRRVSEATFRAGSDSPSSLGMLRRRREKVTSVPRRAMACHRVAIYR